MKRVRGIPILAAALVLLAGCLDVNGGDGAVAPTAGAFEAAEPTVNATSGAIAGVITDEAYQPIAGANVSVRDGDRATATDGEGRFTLNGLAAGEYTLLVGRLGYDAVALLAKVQVNEVTRLVATLAALEVVRPYADSYDMAGRIGCAAVGTGRGFLVPCAGTDPNTKNHWILDVPGTVSTLVLTMTWSATHVVGNEMQLFVDACTSNLNSICADEYAHAVGTSPVVVRIAGEDLRGATPTNETVPVRLRAAPGSSETAPSVVLEQPFTVYVNVFHHEPAPLDFTGVPDQ